MSKEMTDKRKIELLIEAIRTIYQIIEQDGSGVYWQRDLLKNTLEKLESEME